MCWKLKAPIFLNSVSRIWNTFFGKACSSGFCSSPKVGPGSGKAMIDFEEYVGVRPCICDYCIIEDVQYQKISLYFPSQACQSWIRSQCQCRTGKFCWNDVLHTNILKLSMFIPLVFSRKRLNKTEISSWNLSFSCKGNARSPKRHKKALYGSQVLSSKIERLLENFLKSRSGNAASLHIMRTSLSNAQNLTLVRL